MKSVLLYGREGPYDNYCAAIAAAGGRVALCRQPADAAAHDGLLLPGGGDIFGTLDDEESTVIRAFLEAGKPILGICRGMQALNVFFGGTLHDFIPGHQLPEGDLVHLTRSEGLIAQLLGQHPTVNSNHHQAVEQLGTALQAVQWTADSTVEALAHRSLPILGVQWHPERQSFSRRRDDAVDAAPLFYWFLQQCT